MCVVKDGVSCVGEEISFDYDEKCFLPVCEEEACCGEGLTLVPDASRKDDACSCVADFC